MAITVEERRNGRRHDSSGGEIEYIVRATTPEVSTFDSEDAYNQVISTAPAEFNGIPSSNVIVNECLIDLTAVQVWSVSAIYSLDSPTPFPTGSTQYEFNFTAPVGRVYYSLETRSATGASTTYSTTELRNKIRGQDGDEEGMDIPNPTPTNSWIFNIPTGSVSLAYQQGIEAIMGSVNNATWQSRAADTMRLIGCFGGAQNDKHWQLRFDFQFSANRVNVPFGSIVVPSIHGHNLVWSLDETTTAFDGETIRRPKAILVERVFPRVNFGTVLGF